MPEYNSDKFRELILYFSKRGADEGVDVGSTKLNKLLFFSDFRAYAKLGSAITGARYQKLEWGPAPRALLPVRNELIEQGEARLRDSEDWNQILEPQRDPDMSLFSADEVVVIDQVFEEFRSLTAVAASSYSHENSPGWAAADEYDDIPYETARIGTVPPPRHVVEFFRDLHGITA